MLWRTVQGVLVGFTVSPTCPSNTMILKHGARNGFLSAFAVGLGAALGDVLVLMLAVAGLVPVLKRFPWLHGVMWLLGAVVMVWVAISLFHHRHAYPDSSGKSGDTEPGSGGFILGPAWSGFMITVTNPMTLAWWIGLLGPATLADGTIDATYLVAIVAGVLAWATLAATVVHIARRWFTPRVYTALMGVAAAVALAVGGWFLVEGLPYLLGATSAV